VNGRVIGCSVRRIALCALVLILAATTSANAQSETIEYYGLDALGSVRAIFDEQGNLIGRMDYGPFGQNLRAAIKFPTEQFAQLTRDADSGQDYAQARNYSAGTGRFNRVDAVYSGLFAPQRWNRYSYALNNPLSRIDPDGRDPLVAPGFGLWCAFNCPTRPPDGALGSQSNQFQSTAGTEEVMRDLADATEPPDREWVGNDGWLDTTQAVLDVVGGALDLTGVGQVISPVVDLTNAGISLARGNTVGAGVSAWAAIPVIGAPASVAKAGSRIYRVFGNEAPLLGRYWTTVDPRTLTNVAAKLGLHAGNSAERMASAILLQNAGIRKAAPGPLTGLAETAPELFFPNGVGSADDIVIVLTGIVPFGRR